MFGGQPSTLLTRVQNGLRAIGVVSLVGFSFALIACGGDGDKPAPTATSAAAAVGSTPRPSGSASPSPSASTPRPSGSVTPSATGAVRRLRLPDLNSYRYSMRMEGTPGVIAEIVGRPVPSGVNPNTGTLVMEIKGAYVKPDRGTSTTSYGGTQLESVTIGRQQWRNVGGQFQAPTNLSSPDEEDYSFVASFWDNSADDFLKDFSCGSSRETVNGVSTRKCTADRATIDRLNREGKLFSAGGLDVPQFSSASAEIWTTDDGRVIRFRSNMAGKERSNREVTLKIEVDITEINASITINPPR